MEKRKQKGEKAEVVPSDIFYGALTSMISFVSHLNSIDSIKSLPNKKLPTCIRLPIKEIRKLTNSLRITVEELYDLDYGPKLKST